MPTPQPRRTASTHSPPSSVNPSINPLRVSQPQGPTTKVPRPQHPFPPHAATPPGSTLESEVQSPSPASGTLPPAGFFPAPRIAPATGSSIATQAQAIRDSAARSIADGSSSAYAGSRSSSSNGGGCDSSSSAAAGGGGADESSNSSAALVPQPPQQRHVISQSATAGGSHTLPPPPPRPPPPSPFFGSSGGDGSEGCSLLQAKRRRQQAQRRATRQLERSLILPDSAVLHNRSPYLSLITARTSRLEPSLLSVRIRAAKDVRALQSLHKAHTASFHLPT